MCLSRERRKKRLNQEQLPHGPQLSKDAVSAVLYGGVCTGYFTGWVLHGSTRQDLLVLIFLMRQL